jgi:hypothetical protein
MGKTIKIEDIYLKKGKDMKGKDLGKLAKEISFEERVAPGIMEVWVNRVINDLEQSPLDEFPGIIYEHRNDIRGILEFADKFNASNRYGRLPLKTRIDIDVLKQYKKEFNDYWQEMEKK